jgi:hypothetical protein
LASAVLFIGFYGSANTTRIASHLVTRSAYANMESDIAKTSFIAVAPEGPDYGWHILPLVSASISLFSRPA